MEMVATAEHLLEAVVQEVLEEHRQVLVVAAGSGGPGGCQCGYRLWGEPAARRGRGVCPPDGGGGGGGWYGGGAGNGDAGGGGGSSYLSGFDGCVTSYTGYTFRNGDMLAGNQTMPTPEGGTEVGHSGACRARIQLISVD